MARMLSDRDVRRLLGSALKDADEELLNPHGIELRLGTSVRFLSTGEEKTLGEGMFLVVAPGETVLISSLELLDFTSETVEGIFPGSTLTGLITPTTTMMREGISQVTTKIDAGFRGGLNWSLKNGSTKDLTLRYGEPIYKLTLFLVEGDAKPEAMYGERARDRYQDSVGIARSRRSLPVDIPKKSIVRSSVEKLDPKKHLREAGYPFNHIGTELTELHGKWEVVSTDVRLLKDQFERLDKTLTGKIEQETKSLLERISGVSEAVSSQVELLLSEHKLRVIGTLVAIAGFAAGLYKWLLSSASGTVQACVFLGAGALALLLLRLWGRGVRG